MNAVRFAGLLAAVGAVFLVSGCATGSSIVTGQTRAKTEPAGIRVLSKPPAGPYEEIGIVRANSMYSWAITEQMKMDTALKDLKKAAADLGANAIILENVGSEGGSLAGYNAGGVVGGSVQPYCAVSGRAIWISPR